jgi:hypothetical protein
MSNKWSCNQESLGRVINMRRTVRLILLLVIAGFSGAQVASGADAPAWMHAVVNAPLPTHDEKTNAVVLYSEDIVSVQPDGRMKRTERRVYKILRPDGRKLGLVHANFTAENKINSMKGWCIPAQGKIYEVKDKDVVETALLGAMNGDLMSDLKTKLLAIPAPDPGNVVGYEIEQDMNQYVNQDIWEFQEEGVPVREAHYSLQLPAGWEYKATWMNHPDVQPTGGGGSWQWTVSDVPAIKTENGMPPWQVVAGFMAVSVFGGAGVKNNGFQDWKAMGVWENSLTVDRREASPEIKKKTAEVTASAQTPLAKMQALAQFMQKDIRYVSIQLGIGGWQPHRAPEIFIHKFGDCKDKATLFSTMLHEIGVESYYVDINTERATITPSAPATRWFDHVILAVRIPDGVDDPSLKMVIKHPKLGRLLIFDPTDPYTPFGSLRGELQESYTLLVTPDGGELVKLPQLPTETSGIERVAKMTLDKQGTLRGDVVETRLGDAGLWQRAELKAATQTSDQLKRLESLVAHSFATFQITKGVILNLNQTDQPFGYNYSVVAQDYAKNAGNLLLVRPRVIGSDSSDILETKEPRQYPVEMEGPEKDTDAFEIKLPAGYEVDDLPPPVNADYSFASYHSKTEVNGDTLKYTRTFEVKELSVPVNKTEDLKKLYRIIAGDERNTAVLKPKGS